MREFGALVAEKRQQQKLTQAELAKRAYVTRLWLARFETGATADVSLRRTLDVTHALGLTVTVQENPTEAQP
ncbi:MAG: helix-turn-helix domain-containing protein [Terrimesophilobacter sp.]